MEMESKDLEPKESPPIGPSGDTYGTIEILSEEVSMIHPTSEFSSNDNPTLNVSPAFELFRRNQIVSRQFILEVVELSVINK